MFIRWQRSEIRKIFSCLNERVGINTHVLCRHGCGCHPTDSKCEFGYPLNDGRNVYDRLLKAVVCENKRVDGKPKQQHVAFLGSIEESWLPSFFDGIPAEEVEKMKCWDWNGGSLIKRHRFWTTALEKLDRLGNRIPPTERQKLETALAAKIARANEAEVQKFERRAAEFTERLKARSGA